MPSKSLPTFTRAEVESHNTEKSCYVTLGKNVYDVTDFVDSHPGGADLIMEYAGKDIADILRDETSHPHSETAYEVLDDSLVGFLSSSDKLSKSSAANGSTSIDANGNGIEPHPRTGMSCEEDLSKETDYASDYKTHKFLDLGRPLFLQVWNGGFSKEFYLDQVHRPRHYRGGESAPLFGNFLEPLTKTPWWMIPTVWLPAVMYGTYLASEGFSSIFWVIAFWFLGIGVWTIVEYTMHRFLFHLDE
jgi:4-hydroxysphinganine ceramide fatty acyl 2-hydroxylase